MDVQVTSDISDPTAVPTVPLSAPDRAELRTVRRFEIDPASSPMLLAALAWDATPRR